VLITPLLQSHVANEDYPDALSVLASLRGEVDRFFDEVMVNVDEPLLRGNRLGLLKVLSGQLNAVADIARLTL
jgi:glycyl-tRNA synthetase beta chain